VRLLPTRRAFTLLEVMLAVAILSLLTVSLFRFVSANLDALQHSTETSEDKQAVLGAINLLQGQLNELPAKGQGLLAGQALKFKDLPSDQIQWRTRGGVGLLTTAAEEDYRVTMMLAKPDDKTAPILDLMLRRQALTGTEKKEDWVVLIPKCAAIEFRYFDQRLNAWLERWNDQNVRPSLVRVRLWRNAGDVPHVAVLTVPAAMTQQ
jgi:prepilin-type N-terminal cleavage/methylation domain-containing protein